MDYKSFISKSNLYLAFRRLTTLKDARYKGYFRHLLEAYELASKENISDLHNRLLNSQYTPQPPARIYIPKPSGLQRPISLLCLEDQIVLQTISNIFAEKVRERRLPLIGKSIFSNWLSKKKDSVFFLNDWKYGYYQLRKSLLNYFKLGYVWLANFDLSAFYDTVPHELLLRTISPNGGNRELGDFISNSLKTWSADSKSAQHNHGIPQGPNASDFLAECIMLPIDEKMHQSSIYLRYVDDIRILGHSELEVRKALVQLDVLCKERGLIPSSEKTIIKLVRNEKEMVLNIPEILLYFETSGPKQIIEEEAIQEIEKSINKSIEGTITVTDKSRFRYILFRAGQSEKLLEIVLLMWPHNPHHIDAFASFLQNYERVDGVVDICKNEIRFSPYDFVRGEAWKLLARMCNSIELNDLKNWAIEAVKVKTCPATRIGAYKFLNRCEEVGLGLYSKWMMTEESPIIQGILGNDLFTNNQHGLDAAKRFLQRTAIDPSLSLTIPLVKSKLTIADLGFQPGDLSQVAKNVFSKVGILQQNNRARKDMIGERLTKRYKIPYWNKWKILLNTDNQHAYSILVHSETIFKEHKSAWLTQQDSFNDVLFRSFQALLATKQAPGAVPTLKPNGTLRDYGELINVPIFVAAYPTLATHLSAVHIRRNKLPSAHPYDKKTGIKSTWLKLFEQREMVAHLSSAYSEIINICRRLGL